MVFTTLAEQAEHLPKALVADISSIIQSFNESIESVVFLGVWQVDMGLAYK